MILGWSLLGGIAIYLAFDFGRDLWHHVRSRDFDPTLARIRSTLGGTSMASRPRLLDPDHGHAGGLYILIAMTLLLLIVAAAL